MPSINMIAPRRAEKLRLERDMQRLVIVILAEIIIAVFMGGWICTKIMTTNGQISDLDGQLASLQPIVKQIEGYESDTKILAPKLELLKNAKDQTMTWYDSLDRLTQSLPQSTYLTRLGTSSAEKDSSIIKVNLSGVSTSQAKIGETMIRLHAIPDFENIDLHFTQGTEVDRVPAVEFEFGALMKGKTSARGVTAKGAKQNGGNQSKA